MTSPHLDHVSVRDVELVGADRRLPKHVLDMLARRGPTDRQALVSLLGVGRSTLSRAVGALLDAGMVVELDRPSTGRGRPRTLLAVNPRRASAVGFEFGLRHVRGAVVDAAHTVIDTDELPLPVDYSTQDARSVVTAALGRFEELSAGPVIGVGLAIPGPFDRVAGTLTRSSILPEWSGGRVAEQFGAWLDCPVFADNDSNLAAYGEMLWGTGEAVRSLIYLKLHSGIGGAIVMNGSVVRGERGTAGELGHLSYDPQGPLCRCGNRGCLEASAGIPAVLAQMSLGRSRPLTLARAAELVRGGDPRCTAAVDTAARKVGRALASLSNALDPGQILLGGALLQVGDRLLEAIRAGFTSSVLPAHRDVPIRPGALGRYGSALGAAGLVYSCSFDDLLHRVIT
jgi:predicted NBD/HSP70 family sugar kinase